MQWAGRGGHSTPPPPRVMESGLGGFGVLLLEHNSGGEGTGGRKMVIFKEMLSGSAGVGDRTNVPGACYLCNTPRVVNPGLCWIYFPLNASATERHFGSERDRDTLHSYFFFFPNLQALPSSSPLLRRSSSDVVHAECLSFRAYSFVQLAGFKESCTSQQNMHNRCWGLMPSAPDSWQLHALFLHNAIRT